MRLQLSNCSAHYPGAAKQSPEVLKRLNVSLASGEQVAVIGPSGAGKTTLLALLACALKPSSGQMLIDGKNPWALTQRALQSLRRQLFLAPQVPPLPPRQRVVTSVLAGQLPQMSLFKSLRSLFYPVDLPAAQQALAQFDLADKLFDRVDRLSGGERQRVGLARALVADARLMLVDEPLSALDPSRTQQAIVTLTTHAAARGITLLATLHHVEMALNFFPRIIGMRDGEVVFDLPTGQVTEQHLRDLYAQHLDELNGPAPLQDVASSTPNVAAFMRCR